MKCRLYLRDYSVFCDLKKTRRFFQSLLTDSDYDSLQKSSAPSSNYHCLRLQKKAKESLRDKWFDRVSLLVPAVHKHCPLSSVHPSNIFKQQ